MRGDPVECETKGAVNRRKPLILTRFVRGISPGRSPEVDRFRITDIRTPL